MRLEPLCTITMRYTSGSWHHPYGQDVDSAKEGIGFGQGDGDVTGDIEGTTQWANYPRRREDGVWTPNVRGVLTTKTGKSVLLSIHGQSVTEQAPGHRRAVTARVELTSEDTEYRWLNTCFLIGEGEIDPNDGALVAQDIRLHQRGSSGTSGDRARAAGPLPPARLHAGMILRGEHRMEPDNRRIAIGQRHLSALQCG